MQTSPNATFDVVERRIQTLTSILQNMNRRHLPAPSDQSQIPAFLRHLATLLACDDADAITVTGSLTNEELRILVATQNPFGPTEFGVKQITKSTRTFEEVVNGDKTAKLPQHIADVWAAIDSHDPNARGQYHSFCLFIVTRCFQKLSKRVLQDRECWDVSVSQKIFEWTPRTQELEKVRWIERPQWILVDLPPDVHDGMRERTIEVLHGRSVTQWEFSTATLRSWAWLLARMLQQLEFAIALTKSAREENETDQETRGLRNIHNWCYCLHAYVYWREGVVKTLLTKTSLAHAFRLRDDDLNMGTDELADMRREYDESDGQQVFRHLRAIVAWHAAAQSVLNEKHRRVASVGLVEVAPNQPSDVMTDEEVIEEFFRRRPTSSAETRISIENIIRQNHTRKTFTGTTHPEATLMGLLTYFSPGSPYVNHGDQIDEATLRLLKEFIEPALFDKAIAVNNKKCCWCCNTLRSLLDINIKLPSSHGVIFSWTPPRVGVGLSVLQKLENKLWEEMSTAVMDETLYGQGSRSSTPFEEDPRVLEGWRKPAAVGRPPDTNG